MGRTNTPPAVPLLLSFALAAVFAIAADGGSVALAAWFQAATGPRFYPDDPVWVDDDRAFDATKALPTATGDSTTSSSTRSCRPASASTGRR